MGQSLPYTHLSHYRLLSRLGAGGMGEVFLAEDTRLERQVAIKVLPAAFTQDADRLRRFLLEARASSALNHPNIITVHDIGESEAGRFLVMEHVQGRSVRDIMAAGPSLAHLRDLGAQMAKGLAAAHAAGIVHRDIKPDNVMVRDDGYVKILDFGLARLTQSESRRLETATEPGVLMGTLRYMSPEQASGETAGPPSDVYSLGMVLYEIATGRGPYQANSFLGVLNAIVRETPPPASQVNPQLPPEWNGIMMRMLEKDPARRPTAAEVAAFFAQDSAPSAEFATMAIATATWSVPARHAVVGRKREQQELRAALQWVSAGRGLICSVVGEPGIGKSTLVEEFLTGMTAAGQWLIGRGRCSERLAGTEAYLPVLGALESLLQRGSQPGLSATMQQFAPAWYAQVAPLAESGGDTARLLNGGLAISQDRLKRELGLFLQEAARARPLLLFLDDLHWADISTIDILTYLASQFDSLRLLIVVTYRPSDMLLAKHPFLQIKPDLQARGALRELQVGFLDAAEIAQYLNLEFPGHRFPAAFPRLIQAKTEGSPLFMADVIRYLKDREVIAQADGAWRLATELPAIEKDLPESVRGMIERKISQLNEEDRRLLGVASVQGYEFDSAIAARVLGLPPDEVEERLEQLEKVYGFVRLMREAEFPNHELTLRYRFVHALYQNALFHGLRATRRATLSREVAQALEACHGQHSAHAANELAVLWEAARDYAKASTYFAIAARQAAKVFADAEGAELARRGLQALAQTPETPERTDQELALQVMLGVALRAVKGFADPSVGEAFARARELCPHSGQNARLVPVLRGLWEYYEVQSDYGTALPLARQLLALAESLRDDGVLAVACDVMGDTSVWMGEFSTAWQHLDVGIRLYDPDKFRGHLFLYGYDTGMACLTYGAVALWHLGEPDRARANLVAANAIADKLQHPMTRAFAAIMAAWVYRLCGDMEEAERQGELAVNVSTELGLPFFLGFGQITRGWARLGLGKVEAGIADIQDGLAVYRQTESQLGNSLWLGCLAEGYAAAGRLGEALRVLEDALGFATRTGERVYEAELWRLRGEWTGDVTSLERAVQVARAQRARPLEARALASLAGRKRG
jgi:predicted ATPase